MLQERWMLALQAGLHNILREKHSKYGEKTDQTKCTRTRNVEIPEENIWKKNIISVSQNIFSVISKHFIFWTFEHFEHF